MPSNMPRRRSRSRDRDDDDVVNDGNGDDDDIEFGIRGSRRSVSYHHRHSSANHPHRIMEQEVYYDFEVMDAMAKESESERMKMSRR